MVDRYIGVIPAKGESERVPNKNMKLINGHPLIYWTIKAAKESELLDRIIVSTDNEKIKNYFG